MNYRSSFLIFNLIIAAIGIIGGFFLLNDWTFGGGLASGGATIHFGIFLYSLLLSSYYEYGYYLLHFISAGLIGLGGVIGLMMGGEVPFNISKSELGLIDEWIEMKETEIVERYNVKAIEFFDGLWGGLVFLVKFLKNIRPDSIKKLITFLEKQWNGKVFIMTKAGLDDTELASDKYVIYQKDGRLLNYKIEQIDLTD
jgi:hypothetical protein